MIKKITVASLALIMSTSTICAKEHAKIGEFYVVTKALLTISDTVKEGNSVELEGKSGGGMGIDVGYTLPNNFAVEFDTSYSRNNILEKRTVIEGTEEKLEFNNARGKYWTYAFNIVYALPLTDTIGIMGKLGYEFEHETINQLDVNAHDSGMVYGAGIEYYLSEHYEALVEYEGSEIDSPRGSSLYAGLKYIF